MSVRTTLRLGKDNSRAALQAAAGHERPQGRRTHCLPAYTSQQAQHASRQLTEPGVGSWLVQLRDRLLES